MTFGCFLEQFCNMLDGFGAHLRIYFLMNSSDGWKFLGAFWMGVHCSWALAGMLRKCSSLKRASRSLLRQVSVLVSKCVKDVVFLCVCFRYIERYRTLPDALGVSWGL